MTSKNGTKSASGKKASTGVRMPKQRYFKVVKIDASDKTVPSLIRMTGLELQEILSINTLKVLMEWSKNAD